MLFDTFISFGLGPKEEHGLKNLIRKIRKVEKIVSSVTC